MMPATNLIPARLAELTTLYAHVVLCTGTRHDHCGLRDWVHECLDAANPRTVIVGDCPTGVDAHVREWCEDQAVEWHVHKADWTRFGVRAGPRRNSEMVYRACLQSMRGLNVVVLAFPRSGSRGTVDCMRQARRSGLPVEEL